MRRAQIDLVAGALTAPVTKNGKPHSLPFKPRMRDQVSLCCAGLQPGDKLFTGVAADHLSKMAARVGSPPVMLDDLRKLPATVGKRLGLRDAVLRRMLNHAPPKSDTLPALRLAERRGRPGAAVARAGGVADHDGALGGTLTKTPQIAGT